MESKKCSQVYFFSLIASQPNYILPQRKAPYCFFDSIYELIDQYFIPPIKKGPQASR